MPQRLLFAISLGLFSYALFTIVHPTLLMDVDFAFQFLQLMRIHSIGRWFQAVLFRNTISFKF